MLAPVTQTVPFVWGQELVGKGFAWQGPLECETPRILTTWHAKIVGDQLKWCTRTVNTGVLQSKHQASYPSSTALNLIHSPKSVLWKWVLWFCLVTVPAGCWGSRVGCKVVSSLMHSSARIRSCRSGKQLVYQLKWKKTEYWRMPRSFLIKKKRGTCGAWHWKEPEQLEWKGDSIIGKKFCIFIFTFIQTCLLLLNGVVNIKKNNC